MSWFGNKKVNLGLGKNFHYNRLQIIASQVSTIPSHMKEKYDYQSRKLLAVEILRDSSFDALISETIPFAESPTFFNDLRNEKSRNGLIHILQY